MANSAVMTYTVISKNNPWPKKTPMEALIEKSVVKNTRCYTCGTLVYAAEKKMTANHIYHNRCFQCRICKRNLTGLSLNEEGDDIYCTNCYRKKQRGDCDNIQFHRAASERAQYIYNARHPDQPPPMSIPRPPIQRGFSRHPSWTLHQLERQFLSIQPPNISDQQINENFRNFTTISRPLTVKTSFSTPVNLTEFQRHSSLKKDEPSPPLQFLPIFSPFPNLRTQTTVTTPTLSRSTTKPTDGIKSQLSQSSIDLTNISSPLFERKSSIVSSLNGTNENKDKKQTTFRFPDTHVTTIRRRNSNAKYGTNRRIVE